MLRKRRLPRRVLVPVGLLKRRRIAKLSRTQGTLHAMTFAEMDSSALSSTVSFTGRLACMSRAEAFDVVREHGGTPSPSVTRQTKVLVVGEFGWPLLDDGRPSN